MASIANRQLAWPLLVVLALGAFATSLNVTLLSPLLPSIAVDLGVSEATAGQLAAVTAVSSGGTALLVAPWLDRYPRRTWLRVKCSLLLFGTIVSAAAPNFFLLVAGRVVAGVGGAVIGASALAAVGDLEPNQQRRNRAVGFILTAFTFGSVLGLPMMTQIEAAFGWRWAMVSLAPLALIVIVSTGWLPVTAANNHNRRPRWGDWLAGYADALNRPRLAWLVATLVTLMAVWFGWLIYLGAYAAGLGLDAKGISFLFLAGGAAQVAGSNLAPIVLYRVRPFVLGTVAASILATVLVLVSSATAAIDTGALVPFVFLASGAGAMVYACINILLLDAAGTARGMAMALQSAGLEIGGALGVAAMGLTISAFGGFEPAHAVLGGVTIVVVACLRRATSPSD